MLMEFLNQRLVSLDIKECSWLRDQYGYFLCFGFLISFENLEEYHVKVSLKVFSRIKYVHGGRWKIEKVLDKVS